MATLEEILRAITQTPEQSASIGASGYYRNQLGEGETSLGNPEYSQAMQYQNMVRQMNMPKEVLQYNDIPIDKDPFQEYGGRISANIPLDLQKNINVGLSGQGFNSPYYTEQFRPTGVDATYQSGNTGYGMSYEQLSPEQKRLLFSIFKEF
jgi:hypothetical protein